jgi:LEA14-like dessication related protein
MISSWRLASFCFFFLFFLYIISCATQIQPPPETRRVSPIVPPEYPIIPPKYPAARLIFDRIEAVTPDSLSLLFRLEADNPRDEAAHVQAASWKTAVKGVEREDGGVLTMEGGTLAAGSSGTYPLRLKTALAEGMFPDGPAGEAALTADIVFTYASGEEVTKPVEAAVTFPLIRKPEVRITAIAVKKAELINTRFKVSLKVVNPNGFPLELSAFRYELYNAGRFWADGVQEDILTVPPESSAETDIFLTMNFINMNRELLNQIAALKDIRYRFTGEASVSTHIEYFPQFNIKYDLSGHSPVIE